MNHLLQTISTELQPIAKELRITVETVSHPLETSSNLTPEGDRVWVSWSEMIGAWVNLNGVNVQVLIHESGQTMNVGELTLGFTSVLTGICLNLQGQVAIHANAVSFNGIAAAFVGYSGKGKSTLSAYCASRGSGFITDDVLVADAAGNVTPSQLRIKLYPETGERLGLDASEETRYKIFYQPEQLGATLHQSPVPLGVIYLLEESEQDDAIYAEPLSATEAAFNLMSHGYSVSQFLRRSPNLFDAYVRLVERVPVKRFFYPRNFDRLPDVYTFIVKDLQSQ